MIKTTIIIILVFILSITIYSYYCLSSNMIEYEKSRLEYIVNKEKEVKILENKIIAIANCNEKNAKYQKAINNINNIISELSQINIPSHPEINIPSHPEINNVNVESECV